MSKKKDTASKENITVGIHDEESKRSEYHCTGNLELDFNELCTRAAMVIIPKVIMRQKLPSTPPLDINPPDESDKTQIGESTQMKGQFSYFMPKIHVDTAVKDGNSVIDLSIHGWKIDRKMMGIFSRCFPALTNLQEIR
ncbi:hypothetical protein GDO86_010868 [Hymenochirus boettgeri]|uniref:Uncharacterized protein n=1 Tax=Hymenochirus boettgeri TaxID=247094 RepID=A0A8T2J9J0_9PIPI|nr:hypothetical protein GDO86_010868 [Hymenochirus boettgeri]